MRVTPEKDVQQAIQAMVGNTYFELFLKYLKELEEKCIDEALADRETRDERLGAAQILRVVQEEVNTQRKR